MPRRRRSSVYLDSHYVAHVVARGHDGAEQEITLECKLCDEPKLAATVAARVPELLAVLEVQEGEGVAAEPAGGAEPTGAGEPVEPQTKPAAEPRAELEVGGRTRKLGPVGWAGIATGVAGFAGIAVGAVYLHRGTERRLAEDVLYEQVDDHRPMGGALLGVGSTLALTGVVLVIVDATVLAKRRARHGSHAHLGVVQLVGGGGIAATGRF
jgi:hypothetical protein